MRAFWIRAAKCTRSPRRHHLEVRRYYLIILLHLNAREIARHPRVKAGKAQADRHRVTHAADENRCCAERCPEGCPQTRNQEISAPRVLRSGRAIAGIAVPAGRVLFWSSLQCGPWRLC